MQAKMPHIPVLLDDVLASLQPCRGKTIVDGTFGAGGYTRAFLEAGARVIAFDRDPNAIHGGEAMVETAENQLTLIHAPFSEMRAQLSAHGFDQVDAIVLDLGVSSMQIDQAERGFSFMRDGPLDMRMSRAGQSAADLVNGLPEEDLANLIYNYGDERRSRHIAKAIVEQRKTQSFTTTRQLAVLIEQTLGRHPKDKIHPATRSFQALRIAVNQELDELKNLIGDAHDLLKHGGALCIVSFHSLEDRIVKQFFAPQRSPSRHVPPQDLKKSEWKLSKPVSASEQEASRNPRARSARLRVGVKL